MGWRAGCPRSIQDEVCAVTTTRLVTADELLAMPDDGYCYELVDGKLVKMAPAKKKHGRVAARFGARLFVHVEAFDLGEVSAAETGFRLSSNPDTVLAPDAAFISKSRAEQDAVEDGFWEIAPDLAVEVMSPGDTIAVAETKALRWLDAGSLAVVVAAPRRRRVRVYRPAADVVTLTENDILEIDDVVPGWRLPLRELFA